MCRLGGRSGILEVGIKIELKKWPFLMRKLRLSNIQVNIKHKRNKKCSFIEFKTSSQLLILVPYWNPWRRFSFQATILSVM